MASWQVHSAAGLAMWGHTSVAVTERCSIYNFGGVSKHDDRFHVKVLNTGTYEWKDIPLSNTEGTQDYVIPEHRSGQTTVRDHDKVYMFGGYPPDFALWCFDIVKEQWSRPGVTGTVPRPRWGHSACIINRDMFIFGGEVKSGKLEKEAKNDLFILNLDTFSWKKQAFWFLQCRYDHTATSIGNKMVVVGGSGEKEFVEEDRFLQVYDPSTNTWHTPFVTGDIPSPRWGHSSAAHCHGIYIFGGITRERTRCNKLYYYNSANQQWSRIACTGLSPSPRRSHGFLKFEEKLFVFGGITDGQDREDLFEVYISKDDIRSASEMANLQVKKHVGIRNISAEGIRKYNQADRTHYKSEKMEQPNASVKHSVQVVSSSEDFYMKHKNWSFPMNCNPKGLALIININEVSVPTLQLRDGSGADKEKMERLFSSLGYQVRSYEDLTAPAFYDVITDFVQQAEEERAASIFVVLMSHGTTTSRGQAIYLKDGKKMVIRMEMESFFNSRTAPALALVPKVFIIQACQGTDADEGVPEEPLFRHEHDGSKMRSGIPTEAKGNTPVSARRVALFCEYLFANATQPRRPSVRVRNAGSWFIKEVNDVFCQQAAYKHVVELFSEVRKRVGKKQTDLGTVQFTETLDGLSKPFYIFPGICGETHRQK